MAKVIIVDDSSFQAKQFKKFLDALSYEVLAMGKDGNEGVALFKTHRPDLVFLDITMPNKDGRDCLKEILIEAPNAKVVMVSAIEKVAVAEECLEIGAKHFFEKPLRFRDDDFKVEFEEKVSKILSDT